MSRSVKIEHDGATYTLAFNKRTVKQIEASGFVAEQTDNMPATMVEKLFSGAFIWHHPFLKEAVKEEIYERLVDKPGLISILGELYNEALAYLVEEPEDDAKKVKWTVE